MEQKPRREKETKAGDVRREGREGREGKRDQTRRDETKNGERGPRGGGRDGMTIKIWGKKRPVLSRCLVTLSTLKMGMGGA